MRQDQSKRGNQRSRRIRPCIYYVNMFLLLSYNQINYIHGCGSRLRRRNGEQYHQSNHGFDRLRPPLK